MLFNPRTPHFLALGVPLQWIEAGRVLVAMPYMYDQAHNRLDVPFCFIDVERAQYAYYPMMNALPYRIAETGSAWRVEETHRDERFRSHDGEAILPEQMRWLPWAKLEGSVADYFSGFYGSPF